MIDLKLTERFDLGQAACRSEDPELFFTKGREVEAKAICGSCEVSLECLKDVTEWEMQPDQVIIGVVGGLSASERNQIRLRGKVYQ